MHKTQWRNSRHSISTAGSLRTWDCLSYSTDTSDYLPDATNIGLSDIPHRYVSFSPWRHKHGTVWRTAQTRQLLSLTSQTWDCLTYSTDTSYSLPDVTNMGTVWHTAQIRFSPWCHKGRSRSLPLPLSLPLLHYRTGSFALISSLFICPLAVCSFVDGFFDDLFVTYTDQGATLHLTRNNIARHRQHD